MCVSVKHAKKKKEIGSSKGTYLCVMLEGGRVCPKDLEKPTHVKKKKQHVCERDKERKRQT